MASGNQGAQAASAARSMPTAQSGGDIAATMSSVMHGKSVQEGPKSQGHTSEDKAFPNNLLFPFPPLEGFTGTMHLAFSHCIFNINGLCEYMAAQFDHSIKTASLYDKMFHPSQGILYSLIPYFRVKQPYDPFDQFFAPSAGGDEGQAPDVGMSQDAGAYHANEHEHNEARQQQQMHDQQATERDREEYAANQHRRVRGSGMHNPYEADHDSLGSLRPTPTPTHKDREQEMADAKARRRAQENSGKRRAR